MATRIALATSRQRNGRPKAAFSSRERLLWFESAGPQHVARVFVFAAMGEARSAPEPGCEIAITPGETYADTPGRNWRWLGSETIAGRPAHHVACDSELWIDAETRLTLKSRGPAFDADRQPIPGRFHTIEATEVVLGEPPADLFELRPPDGVATIDDEAYSCATNPFCSESPRPVVTPPPVAGEAQLPAMVAEVLAHRALRGRRALVGRGCDRLGGRGVHGVEASALHAFEQDNVPARIDDGDRHGDAFLLRSGDGSGHHLLGALVGQARGVGDVHWCDVPSVRRFA